MIRILTDPITQDELAALCAAHFKTFVKFVADIEKNLLAAGGELHSDAEALLIGGGSMQSDLWGGNFYPWKDAPERLEFTSFINIRPRDGNPGMEVKDAKVRGRMRVLCETLLLGASESLSIPEPSE